MAKFKIIDKNNYVSFTKGDLIVIDDTTIIVYEKDKEVKMVHTVAITPTTSTIIRIENEVRDDDPDPDFIEKINKGEQQISEGKTTKIDPTNVWKSL